MRVRIELPEIIALCGTSLLISGSNPATWWIGVILIVLSLVFSFFRWGLDLSKEQDHKEKPV